MDLAPADLLRPTLAAVVLVLVALIGVYGMHRYWLVLLFRRHRRDSGRPASRFETLPRVTVQLPIYNEGAVVERAIDAACSLDYPRDRLQVQVLDDSTDVSDHLAARRVAMWSERGVDIEHRRRPSRTGYKAGALAEATPHASGELIAIFDADFVPPPAFLKRVVHHFTDPRLGMVQTRWSHLNRDDSLLTRGQAIFLDAHFVVEHTARNRGGAWINFNGTAGLWRKAAIASAGGWQHDTLTEDVDLSYRAQLAGWRFLFLPAVRCPAELPPEINAFKSQQHRWTKGSIQTALKLLPAVFASPAPLRVKLEAFFHLTSPMVYLWVTLFAVLMYPALALNVEAVGRGTWWGLLLGAAMLIAGTFSAATFYLVSQRAQGRGGWAGWRTLVQVPVLMALGVGIALSNAVAVVEALAGHRSEFVRTPKYGDAGRFVHSDKTRRRVIGIPSLRRWVVVLELAMGVYMLACVSLAWDRGPAAIGLPFLLLFAAGYLWVGLGSAWLHIREWRELPETAAV